MDAILEFVFEVLFELIIYVIDFIFDRTSDKILNNTKAKRITKIIIGSILFAVGIIFLSISLSNKKTHLVVVSLAFILSFIILNFILFMNKNMFNKKWISIPIKVVKSISRYVLIILLLYFVDKDLNEGKSKLIMQVTCALSLIFCIALDSAYLSIASRRRVKKKENIKEETNEL